MQNDMDRMDNFKVKYKNAPVMKASIASAGSVVEQHDSHAEAAEQSLQTAIDGDPSAFLTTFQSARKLLTASLLCKKLQTNLQQATAELKKFQTNLQQATAELKKLQTDLQQATAEIKKLQTNLQQQF